MFQEIRADDFLVHHDASIVLDRSHAPDEEGALDEPVEGDDLADVQREEFNDGEASEDDPVGQPLRVVALIVSFDGLH